MQDFLFKQGNLVDARENFTRALVKAPEHFSYHLIRFSIFLWILLAGLGDGLWAQGAPGAQDNACLQPSPVEVCNGFSCQTLYICGVQPGPSDATTPVGMGAQQLINLLKEDLTFKTGASASGSAWDSARDKCSDDSDGSKALQSASASLFDLSGSVTSSLSLAEMAVQGAVSAASAGEKPFSASQDQFFSGANGADPVQATANRARTGYQKAAVIAADCPVQAQSARAQLSSAYQTLNSALSSGSLGNDCSSAISSLIGGGGSVIPSGTSSFSTMETHLQQLEDSCRVEIKAYEQLAKNYTAGDALATYVSTSGQASLALPENNAIVSVPLGIPDARGERTTTRGLASLPGSASLAPIAAASAAGMRASALKPALATSGLDMEDAESGRSLSIRDRLTRATCGRGGSRCDYLEKSEKARREAAQNAKKARVKNRLTLKPKRL